jgi:hypothetical protein
MGDNTEFDLNDLPEEVLNEIANGEVFTIEEELEEAPAPITEESSVVEEPAVEAPVKQTDNEIIDELVVAVEKKVTKKASTKKEPGMYHNGRLIQAVPSRLGKKWVVLIDGKREKVLRSEIEIVE